MPDREHISKKTRFEVFKRDKFTCQYCGKKAPDVLLHVDHVKPVCDGGHGDILNLITACVGCNLGKGGRPLESSVELDAQRKQLEELQARRDQLEMMIAWRDGLSSLTENIVDIVCKRILERTTYEVSDTGKNTVRRWLLRYAPEDVLAAVDRSATTYLRYDGDIVDGVSAGLVFNKIPTCIKYMREEADKPYLGKLVYTQGILRIRLRDRYLKCLDTLESFVLEGLPAEKLEECAKRSDSWDGFLLKAETALQSHTEDAPFEPRGDS